MKFLKRLIVVLLFLGLCGVGGVIGLYLHMAPELPSVDTLKDVELQTPMRIYTSDGQLISQVGEKRRIPLHLDEMPPQLINAVLATEDSRFYEHPGIDPIGMTRAAVNLIMTGTKSQGASTITQQVARNFFLSPEKIWTRKIKEIFLALHIEQVLTKDEILELYLNKIELNYRAFGVGAAAQVYYGRDLNQLTLPELAMIAGMPQSPVLQNPLTYPERAKTRRNVVLSRMLAEGYIDRATFDESRQAPITARYHGASIDLEAAYLAEMVRSELVRLYGEEEAYTQGLQVYTTVHSERQRAANDAVRMNLYDYDMRHGFRGYQQILWDPAGETPEAQPETRELVKQLKRAGRFYDSEAAAVLAVGEQSAVVLDREGEKITLDWDAMKWARRFLTDTRQGPAPQTAADILEVGQQIWIRPDPSRVPEAGSDEPQPWMLSQIPQVSGAMVALHPRTGAVEALVGGFSFRQSKYNNAVQAERLVGSNIKPFVYSAALEKGFTLASQINDAPITQWDQSVGYVWRPRNSPEVYDGPTRLRLGLAQSKNVMSVRLLQEIGTSYTRDYLTRFGFDKDALPNNFTLALGTASMTPMQVATGFTTFANGGYRVEPWFIERIENSVGEVKYRAEPNIACDSCEELLAVQPDIESGFDLAAADSLDPALVFDALQNDDSLEPEMIRQAERVISAENAFLVSQMLESAIWGGGNWSQRTGWNGTGWRAARALERRDIYGKTGTTNDSRDAWFSGFTPELVATSWIGFADPSRNLGKTTSNSNLGKNQITGGEFGAKTALPAWNRFMKVALDGMPVKPMQPPADIVTVRIDRESGLKARQASSQSLMEYFMAGSEPTRFAEPAPRPSGNGNSPGDTDTGGDDEELF